MRDRSISSARQLGASLHDARVRAGLTQAELAARAGVSREWLSGIEQGSRPRAELGKILDVLRALGLTIRLDSAPEAASGRSGAHVGHGSSLTRPVRENMPPPAETGAITRQALRHMRRGADEISGKDSGNP